MRLAALGKKKDSQGDLVRNARPWRVQVCTEAPHGCCCFPPEATGTCVSAVGQRGQK